MIAIRRALLSVSDKTDLIEFAQALAARGVELLSTGGTAAALRQAGLAVKDVSAHTGFPEIMDGRVKTLHPKIHGGLLGRRGTDDAVMAAHGIDPIDLLVVNLYPFEATIAKPDCTLDDAIENIDIGGPAMVRAAAKNHAHVAVVVQPADYAGVAAELAADGALSETTCFALAAKAYAHTADYDTAVSRYLAARVAGAPSGHRASALFQAAGAALRREPAPGRRVLRRSASTGRLDRHGQAAAWQGTVVQQHRGYRRRADVCVCL